MTSDVHLSPSRLTIARKRRGLSGATLARRVNVTPTTIYGYERGRGNPSQQTIDALSHVLEFPREYFLAPEIEPIAEGAVSFRSLKAMTAAERDRALAAGTLALQLSAWVQRRFHLQSPNVPDMREFEPCAAALALREYWGMGADPVGNVVHWLEAKGVRVFSLKEQSARMDAFSLWHSDGLNIEPMVFLNTLKNAEHGRMDAAHELGHLVLHRHGPPRGRDAEAEAWAFAAEFLMPETSVLEHTGRMSAVTVADLLPLKKIWSVSVAALARRLRNLDLLSEWNYRSICIELSQMGRANEPEPLPRETSVVFSQVFQDLRAQGIKKADVARDLCLYVDDLDALIFGLGNTPVSTGVPRKSASAEEIRKEFHLVPGTVIVSETGSE